MIISLAYNGQSFTADLAIPTDISIPLKSGADNPNCFYAPQPLFEPVRGEGFVGSTQEGGAVNFFNVQLNPHGNGTHTECVGHIARENYTINQCLRAFHSIGRLVTVQPEQQGEDRVVTKALLEAAAGHTVQNRRTSSENALSGSPPSDQYGIHGGGFPATLIIRTLPNGTDKRNRQYTNTNPPYLNADAMQWVVEKGIRHLIVDLPSVDREVDGGLLAAHHIFWNYPEATRLNATITEMVYVDDTVADGLYLVNHQIMSIELDASPSKITLYPLLPG